MCRLFGMITYLLQRTSPKCSRARRCTRLRRVPARAASGATADTAARAARRAPVTPNRLFSDTASYSGSPVSILCSCALTTAGEGGVRRSHSTSSRSRTRTSARSAISLLSPTSAPSISAPVKMIIDLAYDQVV